MKIRSLLLLFFLLSIGASAFGQSYMVDIVRDSARSDKFTGGRIEKTALAAGDGNLKITINVPAFQMTLWQNGKEVRSYPIGVGLLDYPIMIGRLEASSVQWNPVWIPPSSDWIEKSSTVKAGEIILPTDPRNPLGKVKIPLGYGYLIHQAKGDGDMGNLVSHGCIRVMQKDLYDLAEKIVSARSLDVTPDQIVEAKRTKITVIGQLEPIVPVEITYDTMVIEAGRLHIYPDVYNYKKNTVANLRKDLRTNGIDDSGISDAALAKMIASASAKKQFVVDAAILETGNALKSGKVIPVLPAQNEVKSKSSLIKRRTARR